MNVTNVAIALLLSAPAYQVDDFQKSMDDEMAVEQEVARLLSLGDVATAERRVDELLVRKAARPVQPAALTGIPTDLLLVLPFTQYGRYDVALKVLKSEDERLSARKPKEWLPKLVKDEPNAEFMSAQSLAGTLRRVKRGLADVLLHLGRIEEARAKLKEMDSIPRLSDFMRRMSEAGGQNLGLFGVAIDAMEANDGESVVPPSGLVIAAREHDRGAFEKAAGELKARASREAAATLQLQLMNASGKSDREFLNRNAKFSRDFAWLNTAPWSGVAGDVKTAAEQFGLLSSTMRSAGEDGGLALLTVDALRANGRRTFSFSTFGLGLSHQAMSLGIAFPDDERARRVSLDWLTRLQSNQHEQRYAFNLGARLTADPQAGALFQKVLRANQVLASMAFSGAEVARPTGSPVWRAMGRAAASGGPARFAAPGAVEDDDEANLPARLRRTPVERADEALDKLRNRLLDVPHGDEDPAAKAAAQARLVDLKRRCRSFAGRSLFSDQELTAEDVRTGLAEDEWFVDVVAVRYFDYRAKSSEPLWKGRRYVAWIVPPSRAGDPSIVDLGDAAAIDAATEAAADAIRKAGPTRESPGIVKELGERAATAMYRDLARQVADRIWKPIEPRLQKAKSLAICLDGALWLLPWEALPLEGEAWLAERFATRYVFSPRELIRGNALVASGPPVVFADPDFDWSGADDAAPAQPQPQPQAAAVSRSVARLRNAPRLPGSATEAVSIGPGLTRFAGAAPAAFQDRLATDEALAGVQSPHTLVLSTHGFFVPKEEAVAFKELSNPLLRSGILLAGSNRRSGQLFDGVFTGLEVLGLDLLGTKLVVLSACETSEGERRDGEAVASLRQAFHIAGAEMVVAASWSVSDAESAKFMKEFFDRLGETRAAPAALREAMVQRIAARRALFRAAHPYFWAPFTISGTARNAPKAAADQGGMKAGPSTTDAVLQKNSLGMNFVRIRPGSFLCGSRETPAEVLKRFPFEKNGVDRPHPFENEQPRHRVEISRPFWLGQTEVTRGQFRRFVDETGYRTDAERQGRGQNPTGASPDDASRDWRNLQVKVDNGNTVLTELHPISMVSWNDADAFLRWLSAKEGKKYRLPTQAEWEYACRAGAETMYSTGDDPNSLARVANVPDASLAGEWKLHYFEALTGNGPDGSEKWRKVHVGVGEKIDATWDGKAWRFDTDMPGKPEDAAPGKAPAAYVRNRPVENFNGEPDPRASLYIRSGGRTIEIAPGATQSTTLVDSNEGMARAIRASDGFGGLAPVASLQPNAWGLFDMHGNVWEWCLDGDEAYPAEAERDPVRKSAADRVVLKGGCFL